MHIPPLEGAFGVSSLCVKEKTSYLEAFLTTWGSSHVARGISTYLKAYGNNEGF